MTEECPLLDLAGDPYTIGYGHGRGAKALIATNLALYTRRYRDEIGLGWEEVLRRVARCGGGAAG